MKICLICGEYPPAPHGGIGTVTRMLATALAQGGHEVRVAGVVPAATSHPELEVHDQVRVWRLREPDRLHGGWLRARYRLFELIARWSRDGEIDLVEVPDWQGWAAGWPALAVPVVARLHGSMSYFAHETGRPAGRLDFRIERASVRRADAICSVSRYTADRTATLFGLDPAAIVVLHNPVEPVDLPARPVPGRVIFAGTLTPKKGVLELMDAWSEVAARCPDAELHCYGKDGRTADGGSMREAMLRRTEAAARARLHFHGHTPREQLRMALAEASVAVFPSFAEAFAMAPLEAMAAGCATIASSRGSGPELFDHGRHGLLVDPARPADLAAAIVRLLRDPVERGRLARAGQAWVNERNDIRRLTAANVAFYEHVCAEVARGRRSRHGHAGTGPRAA